MGMNSCGCARETPVAGAAKRGKSQSLVPQRSKLTSLALVGATGRQYARDYYIELSTSFRQGGDIVLAVSSRSFRISLPGLGLPEVVVSQTHQLSAKRIRIGVAESTRMASQLIAEALKHRRNNFEVLAFAEDSSRAFRELQKYEPHVAVISVELQDGPFKGFSVLDRMRASKAKAAAIMLLNSDERELVLDAFRGGARGIFCRGHSFEALPKCIRAVHQGQIWVNNNQLEFVMQLISHQRQTHPGRRGLNTLLTPREREVVELVTEDMKNHEIALRLGLKDHTVRNYILQIFEKLGVSTRVGLVLYAIGEPAINERRPAP